MSYVAHKKQALVHRAFLQEGYKRGVYLAGRQSGKTFFATQHAWISAVKDQGRYFIVFQTYKQAHEVVWRQYVPLIPKELIFKTNEQDLLIELNYIENTPMKLPSGETIIINHDKNKPRSTIQLLGSDQADTHRGFKANGMIFDEYATQNPDHWDSVYKHFFTTTDGWALFMGTPRGYNHFYDLIEYAKVNGKKEQEERRANGEKVEDYPWFYLEATWRDSPYVKAEFIAAERAEAKKKGTLSQFMQEVELEFRVVQGAVYPDFDRKIHILKPSEIPDDLTYYGAIDFGWHTTAFLLMGVDKDQTWYVVDEIYGKEDTLDNIIPRIKDKVGDKRMVLVIGDSANRDAIEVMSRDFPMMGVNKANDSKGYALGISLITEKLKPRVQLIGLPKPSLYFSNVCKNLIFETESYRFPEDKPERNAADVPIKENDHGCFIASTTVLTKEGPVFIDKIKAGDKVITPFGEETVMNAQSMGVKKVIGYDRFTVTPDHPIITNEGIAPVDALRYNSKVWLQLNQKQFTLTEYLIAGILTRKKEVRDFILGGLLTRNLEAKLATYIGTYGNIFEEIFLRDLLSTTKTDTMITVSKVLNSLQAKNTLSVITGENTKVTKRFSKVLDHLRKNGIVPILGGSGTQNMGDVLGWEDRAWLQTVMCAVEDTILTSLVEVGSVLEPVKLRISDEQEVFNLATPSGMFFANGILVSNCDALRYLFLQLKFGVQKEDKEPTFEMTKSLNPYGLL